MVSRFSIALLIGYLLAHSAGSAQNIEAYTNQTNKRDTLIAFGATAPFVSVSKTLWVYNGSASDIRLKPMLTDMKGAVSDVINEFGGLFANEVVQAGQTRPFTVLYKADYVSFPLDSLAEARVVLDIEDAVTQRQILRKVFLLAGVKTNNLLGSSTRVVNFDTVFISSGCSSSSIFTIQSVVDAPVQVLAQTLRRTTPSLGNIEFAVDTFPSIEFTGKSSVAWTLHYTPADTGYDAAEFTVSYKNPNLTRDSSVRVDMRGVGVRHTFRPTQILVLDGSSITPNVRGDTIDIGELPQNRDSVVIGVVLRNDGNIRVNVDSVSFAEPTTSFMVRSGGVGRFQAMGLDTIHIVFKPGKASRLSSAILQLLSDVERRGFSCTPFNARLSRCTIIGRNRARALLDIDTLDFGIVEMPRSCQVAVTSQFAIQNIGSSTCTVDSVSFDPQDEGVTLSTGTPFSIRSDASYVVDCSIAPRRYGVLQGTIRLWLSTAQRFIDLPYRATVVKPDTVLISIASEVRARPGRIIDVPVFWEAKGANRIQRVEFVVDVNPTILKYAGASTSQSACANALVTATPTSRGVRFACTDDAGLLQRDTLVTLRFQTFLGDSAQSNIVVDANATTLGTKQCPDTYPSVLRHGSFISDSLCGLSYKTHGAAMGLRASAFPNPAADAIRIVIMDNVKGLTEIALVDTYGRPLQPTLSREVDGLETVQMDVSGLPCGQYTCIVQRGLFTVHIPITVAR